MYMIGIHGKTPRFAPTIPIIHHLTYSVFFIPLRAALFSQSVSNNFLNKSTIIVSVRVSLTSVRATTYNSIDIVRKMKSRFDQRRQ